MTQTAKTQGRFASLETSQGRSGMGGRRSTVRDAVFFLDDGLLSELAGDHEKALNTYSKALSENPLLIVAWARQLWMLIYLEEYYEADTWSDKALQSFPNDPDILSLKSLALWRNGFKDEAKTLNDAALGMSRDSHNTWLARGEMQVADGVKSYRSCFSHAARVSTVPGLAELRAGDILYRYRHYTPAMSFYRDATSLLPQSSWAWYGYGLTQRALGREHYAVKAFERAHSLSPRDYRYKMAPRGKQGMWSRLWRFLNSEK